MKKQENNLKFLQGMRDAELEMGKSLVISEDAKKCLAHAEKAKAEMDKRARDIRFG